MRLHLLHPGVGLALLQPQAAHEGSHEARGLLHRSVQVRAVELFELLVSQLPLVCNLGSLDIGSQLLTKPCSICSKTNQVVQGAQECLVLLQRSSSIHKYQDHGLGHLDNQLGTLDRLDLLGLRLHGRMEQGCPRALGNGRWHSSQPRHIIKGPLRRVHRELAGNGGDELLVRLERGVLEELRQGRHFGRLPSGREPAEAPLFLFHCGFRGGRQGRGQRCRRGRGRRQGRRGCWRWRRRHGRLRGLCGCAGRLRQGCAQALLQLVVDVCKRLVRRPCPKGWPPPPP
mmetsp:Transcript_104697/g.337558  ORF Transcript_104697/g.337558 Transcript_104697/m.337558 type:complete len:286 (+) Transcript_104697:329-1186(+)